VHTNISRSRGYRLNASQVAYACPERAHMPLTASFRERKYTFKRFSEVNLLLQEITLAFQDPPLMDVVERITGTARQVPDSSLYAGD